MEPDKIKEGVSVKQIEYFARKHRLEVFYCLLFLLACLFSWAFFGTGWSVVFATVGAILGVLLAPKIEFITKKMLHFVFKQEPTTQIVLAVVSLIIAIFLPPLIFLLLGAQGGKALFHQSMETRAEHNKMQE